MDQRSGFPPVDRKVLTLESQQMTKLQNRLNDDFSARIVINTNDQPWVPSPTIGVERRPLDRIGAEVARATSLVKYDPNSAFPTHVHSGGEEYLVIEGIFSDEEGDHPAGNYVRNPVGSKHAPHTKYGCIILVKLHQMPKDQQRAIVINTNDPNNWASTDFTGIERCVLFDDPTTGETVEMFRMNPGSSFIEFQVTDGEEIFVLEGSVEDDQGIYPKGTWIRNPDGLKYRLSSKSGATIWRKIGHLTNAALDLFKH